jgi:adenylate cyclase
LPERVRHAIAVDQRSSEILVCLAQFGAIAFFGAFYELTPKAFPPSVMFEPVPWALGLYALFTALRLWLTLRGRLNAGFLSLSVVVDIAVLMVTIWSFHLQYQQPATIYLKAPTLLYVFILISLRAMRFEAVYIVLAGVSAILGWLALVAYAVYDAGGMRLTHNFVEYMTSNTILIGAEIDKLLSFAAVTAVLAIAIVRARRLLINAASEAHAATELSRFFAPEVAGEIRRADMRLKPGDAVTREAAVMFLDLRGFTKLAARLAPTETMAVLGDYHRRMVPVIQAHGGSIDKYLGDGILSSFGAARPSQTYAADALRALGEVLAAADAWNTDRAECGEPPLGIGAAVAVGPVLFGVTGDASRLEFTVIGDVVNLAAKLEKHCKVAARPALATRAALDLADAQGFGGAPTYTILPGEAVGGVAEPIDLAAPC